VDARAEALHPVSEAHGREGSFDLDGTVVNAGLDGDAAMKLSHRISESPRSDAPVERVLLSRLDQTRIDARRQVGSITSGYKVRRKLEGILALPAGGAGKTVGLAAPGGGVPIAGALQEGPKHLAVEAFELRKAYRELGIALGLGLRNERAHPLVAGHGVERPELDVDGGPHPFGQRQIGEQDGVYLALLEPLESHAPKDLVSSLKEPSDECVGCGVKEGSVRKAP
jgi:hypothetical protein